MALSEPKTTEFLLPNELGWQCNDEVADEIKTQFSKLLNELMKYDIRKDYREVAFMTDVAIAEMSDNVYAIIKKYQGR